MRLFSAPKESVLTRGFRARLNRTPIKTNRFLWHINDSTEDKNLSIAANGLLCRPDYAVFAHNNLQWFEDMYPYFIDKWVEAYDASLNFSYLETYSFWRIDTQLLDKPWYVDVNMQDEIKNKSLSFASTHNYVCTLHNIPYKALKLFKYDAQQYAADRTIMIKNEGVTMIRQKQSDFQTLKPVAHINKYIDWRIKNKLNCK